MTALAAASASENASDEMPLFAHPIRFGEPGFHLGIDLIHALEPEGVQIISRRESLDAAEARIFQTTREHDVPINPVPPDDERGETHSDLKCNPGFLREHGDWPVSPGDALQLSENLANTRRFSLEVGSERVTAARVGLI